jgi:hypothetical protein
MLSGQIRRLARLPQLLRRGVEPVAQRAGSAALVVPARLCPFHTATFCSKVRQGLV